VVGGYVIKVVNYFNAYLLAVIIFDMVKARTSQVDIEAIVLVLFTDNLRQVVKNTVLMTCLL
jgi:hypothetical protein